MDENIIQPLSYYVSDTGYPAHEYTQYKGTEQGNLQLKQNIQNMTSGALAIIISIVNPVLGTIFSAGLILYAIETNINAQAIFYEKKRWDHQTLGSLAQEYFVQMYWDPDYTKKAGSQTKYYRTWA